MMAVFVFIVCVLLVYALEFLLLVKFFIKSKKGEKTLYLKKYWILHSLAISGIFCMAYGYFIEPYWIETKTVVIYTEKLQNTRFRVIHISDLHCDPVVRAEDSLVKKISDLKPDIVLFTGDCINSPEGLKVFQDTMARIEAPYGKYAVLGNWDISWTYLDRFAGTGFRVLNHEDISCTKGGESIKILGISQYAPAFPQKFSSLSKDFRIFLYHLPDLIEEIGNAPVSLYLCGHTHGGQIALPFYGALITLAAHGKKYESGLYTVGNSMLYVNRGIGMEGGGYVPRVRFWSRPEITVFEILPKPKE